MRILPWFTCLMPFGLMACGGHNGNSEPPVATYEITLLNATSNQPLSPLAAGLQMQGRAAWYIGAPAGNGLEQLAEGGDAIPFLQDLESDAVTTMGTGIIAPGSAETVTLTATAGRPLALTLASMLVNTNDAFTGVTDLHLDHFTVGELYTSLLPIYDAGTEANSEMPFTIPGPAASGEGYNSTRDDAGFVTMHAGVVSADDGLEGSALDESHRFASGSIALKIVRIR